MAKREPLNELDFIKDEIDIKRIKKQHDNSYFDSMESAMSISKIGDELQNYTEIKSRSLNILQNGTSILSDDDNAMSELLANVFTQFKDEEILGIKPANEELLFTEDDVDNTIESVNDANVNITIQDTSSSTDKSGKGLKRKKLKLPIPWVKILTFEDKPSDNSVSRKVQFAVDAFNYREHESIEYYFLTHFHSDHYYGITKSWNNGIIFCTEVTAKLLNLKYKTSYDIMVPVKFETTYEIVENLFATWIDANHCPGSAIILFEFVKSTPSMQEDMEEPEIFKLQNSQSTQPKHAHYINDSSVQNRQYIRARENHGAKVFRILHTGDFRVCSTILTHPLLANYKIDQLYLDTTYLDPRYSFPEQDSVVKQCGNFATELLDGSFYRKLSSYKSKSGLLATGNVQVFFQKRITDFFTAIGKQVKQESSIEQQKPKAPIVIDLENEFESDDFESSKESTPTAEKVEGFKNDYLICIGTYSIGKEKIAIELAQRLNLKIFANHSKREILNTFDRSFLPFEDIITDDPYSTNIHLIPMRHLSSLATLEQYYQPLKLRFKNIIGIRPTGWTLRSKPSFTARELRELDKKDILVRSVQTKMPFSVANFADQFNSNRVVQVYEIPYSEHSSFRELCMLILLLNVDRIIPTVNLHNQESIKRMEEWFDLCKALKEERNFSIDDF